MNSRLKFFLSLFTLLFLLASNPLISFGSDFKLSWQAFLLSPESGAVESRAESSPSPESRIAVAITLEMPEESYIYGTAEGSEGLATKVIARSVYTGAAAREQSVSVLAPQPKFRSETRFADSSGEKGPLIYAGSTTFVTFVPVKNGTVTVNLQASGLLCSELNCTPFDEKLSIAFSEDRIKSLPLASGKQLSDGLLGEPVLESGLETGLEQGLKSGLETGQGVGLETGQGAGLETGQGVGLETGQGVGLVLESASSGSTARSATIINYAEISPQYFKPELEVTELGTAIFFGILAGLILNLMPCVLPVISLKFSALMAVSTMTDKREQAKRFRMHCLLFAAGVMSWFIFIAFLLGLAGMAWGEMFQSPILVGVLGLVLFLLGLSLFGVFHLPIFDLKVSSPSHPHWQAYGSGLLATLLATPCSGPLLGGVLGWALRQPLDHLVLTVASIGVGMAFPYCVMAMIPRLVHILPKPGSWTLRLEQLLGFFLMGSVLYMGTLLPPNWLLPYLFCLMGTAFAAWIWGQIGHLRASPKRRFIAKSCAILTIAVTIFLANFAIKENFNWEPYDSYTFSTLLGKEPLLLEFTADWCPSCKVLEHTTLNERRMAKLRNKYKMRTIRVDLTRDGSDGKELLESLGSKSIPVVALFPVGENSNKPMVLRDIFTPAQLKEALKQTF